MKTTERPIEECTDRELLARFVARAEQDAFSQIVRRHGPLVLGVCRRLLVCPQDADDVFQSTFLALARRAKRGKWHVSIAGWLYKVAYHACLRLRAHNAARRTTVLESETMIEDTQLLEVASREEQEKLHAEVLALPVKYRDPLLLCCLEGMSREEAARELDCSVVTLKGRLQRGRQELLLRLGMRGIVLSAALASLEGTVAAAQTGLSETLVTRTTQAAVAHAAGQLSLQSYLPGQVAVSKGAVKSMIKYFLIRTAMMAALGTAVMTLGIVSVSGAGDRQRPDSEPVVVVGSIEDDGETLNLTFVAEDEPEQAEPDHPNIFAEPPGGVDPLATNSTTTPAPRKTAEQAIREVLSAPTSLTFDEVSLTDAIAFLREQHKIHLHLDKQSIEESGGEDVPTVTMELSGVKLETALRLLLEPTGLTTVVVDNTVLITTQDKADMMLETRPVAVGALLDKAQIDVQDLVDVIVTTIAPESWDEVGGFGSIRGLGRLLVIRQSQKVHDEITKLLDQLNKQAVEIRASRAAANGPAAQPGHEGLGFHVYPSPKPSVIRPSATKAPDPFGLGPE